MDQLEHIKKGAEEIRLTSAERSAMREVLESHMRLNPVATPSPYWGLRSPFQTVVFAFAVLIVVGGGTSLAAEGTVPGDTLYTLKVSLVEPVAGSLKVGEVAQASWQAELASRRLSEVDDLVASDSLSEDVTLEVAARVAEATSEAAKKIDALAAKDEAKASRAAVKLDRALSQHGTTLRRLEGAGDITATPILRAAADIAHASLEAEVARVEAFSATMAAPVADTAFTMSAKSAERDDDDEDEYRKATKLFERTRELARDSRERGDDREDD